MTRAIGVLDTHQKLTIVVARVEPVINGCAGVTNMHETCRGWRKSCYDSHSILDPNIYLTVKLLISITEYHKFEQGALVSWR